jgi:succinate dehydrogenase / fumarate reductase flavoprotein subunit
VRTGEVGVVGHREFNPGWHTALDLKNLLAVSEAIALSALAREESRGAQFREDFPEKDATWGGLNNVVRKGSDGTMELEKVPIQEIPADLQAIIDEMA